MEVPSLESDGGGSQYTTPSSTRRYRISTTMQSTTKPRNCNLGTTKAEEVTTGQMYEDRRELDLRVVRKLLTARSNEGSM
jgi:hypothetical protein